MIAPGTPACDVLYVGRSDLPELAELERAGFRVARAPSALAAMERLRDGGAAVAIVHADAVAGRESDVFPALRESGAASVVGVYPPAAAWRADRAVPSGADAAIVLPAAPGAVLATAALRIAHPPVPALPVAAPAAVALPAPAEPPVMPPETVRATEPTVPAAPPRSWLESVLADVATMNRTLEHLDRLLDQVLATFQRRAQAERCSVLLYDRKREELRVRRTTTPAGEGAAETVVPAGSLASQVARSGRPLLLADVAAAPPDVAPLVAGRGHGYRSTSCLLLPLRGVEDVLGVVCLADRRDGAPFRDADVPPLEFLAAQAGQALDNSMRFQRLQELAAVDALTGLANRRQFQASLEREVLRARRYDRQVSLCLLDLDHFKQYNDRCGHQAGDRALEIVGEILRTSLREVDVVARYGGEEFAIILPETAPRPAGGARNPYPFLERVRRRIEETVFEGEEKLPGGKLTVSGGVACFPDDAVTLDELVREADRALYVSKSRGRNRISYRGETFSE